MEFRRARGGARGACAREWARARLLALVAALPAGLLLLGCGEEAAPPEMPRPAVTVAEVVAEDILETGAELAESDVRNAQVLSQFVTAANSTVLTDEVAAAIAGVSDSIGPVKPRMIPTLISSAEAVADSASSVDAISIFFISFSLRWLVKDSDCYIFRGDSGIPLRGSA